MKKFSKNHELICTIVSPKAHTLEKDRMIVGFGPTISKIAYLTTCPAIKDHQNILATLNDRKKLDYCSKNINGDAKHYTFEKYISELENAVLR